MSAPTPGPWTAVKGAAGSHPDVWEIVSDLGDHEYEVVGHVSTRRFSTLTRFDSGVVASNARLIAAAPDMLAALRRAVLALAFAAESSPAMQDDYEAVSAAIAKATGRTE